VRPKWRRAARRPGGSELCRSSSYTARTLKGDLVNDKIDLPSRDDVIAHLRKNRMVSCSPAAPKEFKLNLKFRRRRQDRDVVVFTRQFPR